MHTHSLINVPLAGFNELISIHAYINPPLTPPLPAHPPTSPPCLSKVGRELTGGRGDAVAQDGGGDRGEVVRKAWGDCVMRLRGHGDCYPL